MNQEQIRHALSLHNTAHISEATRIAPHTLQRIIDGSHLPDPEQIDALAGFFNGEYFLCGNDFNWKRNRKSEAALGTLPLGCDLDPAILPQEEWSPYPPTLVPGEAPTGTGANTDGMTGTGVRVR